MKLLQKYIDLPEQPEDAVPGEYPLSDFRNARFKLSPGVREGPWVVKQAVGSKPTLLASKLTQRYFRGPGYMETDVDIGSSVVASRIVGVCVGAAKALTIDIGLTLEGRDEDELPERLIGVSTVAKVDTTMSEPLYGSDRDEE